MTDYAYFKREKAPDGTEDYALIFCDIDGTNANTSANTGYLAGETIASYALEVTTGTVTIASDNSDAATIAGIAYAANTIVSFRLTGGAEDEQATIKCTVTTSGGRILPVHRTIAINTS